MLSGNVDTDKKHSQINMLLTRGIAWLRQWFSSATSLKT